MTKQLALKQGALAVLLAFSGADYALAQQAASTAPTTVYITGSNLKRTAKESTNVVQVLTAQDIKNTGAQSVQELMKTIPAVGSDNNFDVTDGGFSRGAATVSLRNLSSTSTLVLLNGRRVVIGAYADPNDGNSSLYDLNSIPVSALERVEILKEGASAIYGSDAVAGVINFITKTNYQGVEVSARAGANDDGKFGRQGVNLVVGKGDLATDGYNIFATLDVAHRDRTRRDEARDIEWDTYRTLNNRYATQFGSFISSSPTFYKETKPGSKSFGVTQATRDNNMRITLNCDPSQQITGTPATGLPSTSVFMNRKFCNYDLLQYLEAQSAGKDTNLMSRGEIRINDNWSAFAEVAFSRSERTYTGTSGSRTLGQSVVTNYTQSGTGDPFQAILEIGHPDNPFTNARASVGYRFENLPVGNNNRNDYLRALAGVRGSAMGWDIESALLWNEARRKDTTLGQLYLPTLRKLNTGTTLAQLAADPTLGRNVTNNNTSSFTQIDLRANREFGPELPGGKMAVALGGEYRKEKMDLNPDEVLASGNILGLANTVLHGQRDVKSFYTEFRAPVLKTLELSAAGRIDKFEKLETSRVPQFGIKWTPVEQFAVRGAYSRGFRAPALNQVTPGGSQFFLSGLYDPKRCQVDEKTPKPNAFTTDCQKSTAGVGGFNPDLRPEKSKSYTLGLILAPMSNVGITIDYFRIRKEGEVILGSASEVLKHEDSNPENVVRDTNPANFVTDANGNPIPGTGPLLMVREPWLNQGAKDIKGIDFDATITNKLDSWGSLLTKFSGTYTHSYKIAQHAGDIEHNVVGKDPGLWDWNLSNNTRVPRFKGYLSTTWRFADVHSINASLQYVGPISLMRQYDAETTYAAPFCHYGTKKPTDAAPNRDPNVPLYEAYFPKCQINSWTTVGLGYTYTGIQNLTLSVNIKNLFDEKAPYVPNSGIHTSSIYPLAGYSEQLHSNQGRYFSLNATYRF